MATKVEQARTAASQAWDAFSNEFAKYSEDNMPTPDQAGNIDTLRNAATTAQQELTAAEQWSRKAGQYGDEIEKMIRPQASGEAQHFDGTRDRRDPRMSIGTQFVNHEPYKDWLRQIAPNGRVPERSTLTSPPLHFGGIRELEQLALITSDPTSAGELFMAAQHPGIIAYNRMPLTVRQIITNLQTDSDSIEFVRTLTEVNNAGVVAEATSVSGSSGVKPQSDMSFERVSTPVKTVAHWMAATSRILTDASQLRGFIDNFLRYGVELELEDQIINGDGLGDNFDGLLSTSGIQNQAWDTDLFTTTRKARRKVRTVGRRTPNAFVFHPEDWENVELAQDNAGRYYYNGPIDMGPERHWRLPVIECEALPVGTGLVGDFTQAVLWDRQAASISVSNSHADFFIRNLVAILCEIRAAFGVLKPDAFVVIDLTA